LFGTSTPPADTKATTAKKPAETPAAAEGKTDEKPPTPPAGDNKGKTEDKKSDDNLFGASPSVLREAGGLASDEMRTWTDNTGGFSCHGRLVRFLNGHVRILKENGHTTTVPLARLSVRDLEFVNRQASAQRAELGKTAQASTAVEKLAN
jgi:hypothetical protein